MSEHAKVTAGHRQRRAVVYVRQSTPGQVERNTESSARQYGLAERAVELGWPAESVVVVDEDTGRSAAWARSRIGFRELVAEVGLGHVGVILASEVSRLARSLADWHQLLDLCALTATLICDGDGIYSPGEFNDRLLLGLKGTMSEAELHLIRSRLRGGIENKAQRGELRLNLPIGLEPTGNAAAYAYNSGRTNEASYPRSAATEVSISSETRLSTTRVCGAGATRRDRGGCPGDWRARRERGSPESCAGYAAAPAGSSPAIPQPVRFEVAVACGFVVSVVLVGRAALGMTPQLMSL
jgi:DNA invertase Pin-like site-specific DNA recombinase